MLFAWNLDDVRRKGYCLAPHFVRIIYVANIVRYHKQQKKSLRLESLSNLQCLFFLMSPGISCNFLFVTKSCKATVTYPEFFGDIVFNRAFGGSCDAPNGSRTKSWWGPKGWSPQKLLRFSSWDLTQCNFG